MKTFRDSTQAVEFQVPPGGLAVAFIGEVSVLFVLSEEDLTMIEHADWRVLSGLQPGQVKMVRLIGSEAVIARYVAHFERAGFPLGKVVSLKEGQSTLQFLPSDGRLRIEARPVQNRRQRVLVVDDSETIRKLLASVISQDPELECVGSVDHPSLVAKAIEELKPDVITLDIHMPEMTGNQLVKQLLAKYPIPIVMITSLSMEDGHYVLDALENGAVDYIQKPSMQQLQEVAPIIREKLRMAAKVKISITRKARPSHERTQVASNEIDFGFLIAIGSSTGGTEALREVLTSLPVNIPPIVIVQHIPAGFSQAFAERMNQLCKFEVKEARDGDEVLPDRVLIAPGGLQMRLKERGGRLITKVEDTPSVNRHKPSVDVLFESILGLNRKKVAAAILTGMGADGARGLCDLRKQGARTLAQDEATCVVFGMPREAIKLGGAEKTVPIQDVGAVLIDFCQKKALIRSLA